MLVSGDRDLPVLTSGNWVIKGWVIKWPVKLRTFFTFFLRFFSKSKKRDFLRFFEWLTTFSRTLRHCHCRLPGLSNVSYSDRLAILGLRSLQMRRLHQDLIYTYKIIFGLVDLDCPKFFLISWNETARWHLNKLFVRHSRVDVRKYLLVSICVSLLCKIKPLPAVNPKLTNMNEKMNARCLRRTQGPDGLNPAWGSGRPHWPKVGLVMAARSSLLRTRGELSLKRLPVAPHLCENRQKLPASWGKTLTPLGALPRPMQTLAHRAGRDTPPL